MLAVPEALAEKRPGVDDAPPVISAGWLSNSLLVSIQSTYCMPDPIELVKSPIPNKPLKSKYCNPL